MTQDDLLVLHNHVCTNARRLMQQKNDDYAHGDDPFANFRASETLGVDPKIGLLLRMQDKLKRLYTFAERGALTLEHEGAHDSVLDIINYAVLYGAMVIDENEDAAKREPHDTRSEHYSEQLHESNKNPNAARWGG